jgi:murein L,D-transpeptidase YafK
MAINSEPADSLPGLPDSLRSTDTLLVVWKNMYRMRLYHKGEIVKTYIIGLGQDPAGHKEQQGDNRTPEGDYRIIEKSKGPFYGDYSAWFGVAWMRLNYPNNADAIAGYKKKLITEAQKNSIIAANNAGLEPSKYTKLGGGIGIHGWNGEWPGSDRQNLTWGCISVQNGELDDLYSRVNVGTRIVIYP